MGSGESRGVGSAGRWRCWALGVVFYKMNVSLESHHAFKIEFRFLGFWLSFSQHNLFNTFSKPYFSKPFQIFLCFSKPSQILL